MRPLVILIAAILMCQLAAADGEKLATLTLKNGKSYSGVTITKKTADGIAIMHESGTARVPFEKLPDDLVKKLGGFDPAAAEKARAESLANEATLDAAVSEMTDKKAYAKLLKEAARPVVIDVVQSTDGGALCRISFVSEKTVSDTIEGKDAFGRSVKNVTTKKITDMSPFTDQLQFVEGVDTVDGNRYTAWVMKSGTYKYRKITGAEATVQKWSIVDMEKVKKESR